MSFQGTATISRISQELSEEFTSLGFDVNEAQIRRHLSESDVVPDNDWDVWVECTGFIPGELNRYPHLVFCTQENTPGSAVNRRYVAI